MPHHYTSCLIYQTPAIPLGLSVPTRASMGLAVNEPSGLPARASGQGQRSSDAPSPRIRIGRPLSRVPRCGEHLAVERVEHCRKREPSVLIGHRITLRTESHGALAIRRIGEAFLPDASGVEFERGRGCSYAHRGKWRIFDQVPNFAMRNPMDCRAGCCAMVPGHGQGDTSRAVALGPVNASAERPRHRGRTAQSLCRPSRLGRCAS